MFECNIRVLGLPGAWFNSQAAIETYGPDARAYESAIADYEETGCEVTLWDNLQGLRFNAEEIQWHIARPGKRMPLGYI